MYKLIALDMDGTLLKEDKTISLRTKEAIQKAREQGVTVVIATGRPLEGIEPYLKELQMTTDKDYVLSFNGCVVKNVGTRKTISKTVLKGKDLLRLYKCANELNVHMHAFSTEGCITPEMNPYSELEGSLNHIPVKIKDFATVDPEEDVIKFMMVDDEEKLEQVIQALPKELFEDYTVVRSAPFFLEFLNKKAHKGAGVKALAEHLGIEQKEIICIGDAGNDLDMIRFAGLGVAMGNAFEEVKQEADYITADNESDGIVQVIEEFVLNA